jgi:hypothetical protein
VRAGSVDAGLDEGVQVGCGHGSSEVVALAGVAAQPVDLVVLLGGFHALGHDGHAEAMNEVDDRVDDEVTG